MGRCAIPVLSLLLAAHGALAVTVVSASRSGAAARATEWRALVEVNAESRRFWVSQWSGLEADMKRLHDVAAPTPAKKEHRKSPLAGLKLNFEPKSPTDLIPALTMLKGLYEDGKSRIGKLNVKEKDLKAQFEVKRTEHERRIQAIEVRIKKGTLSAEWRANETRDENRLWKYWERVRDIEHKQYHTYLKIQHGTLEKTKTMIDMYEKTISGKADKTTVAKQLRKVGGGALPDIVFLQAAQAATVRFCEQATSELHSAQKEGQQALSVEVV